MHVVIITHSSTHAEFLCFIVPDRHLRCPVILIRFEQKNIQYSLARANAMFPENMMCYCFWKDVVFYGRSLAGTSRIVMSLSLRNSFILVLYFFAVLYHYKG